MSGQHESIRIFSKHLFRIKSGKMREDEVKKLAREWLEAQGYTVKPEPPAPIDSEERELALDFHAYRDKEPEIIWVECKGDVNLSELLEGFVRVEFCIHYGGGLGLLAVPSRAKRILLKYKDFLKQAESTVAILDVEESKIYKLN